MLFNKNIIIICMLIASGYCYEFPSTFGKCSKSDKNMDDCLVEKIGDAMKELKNGLSELGMRSLGTFEIKSLTVGEGTGPVRLTQEFKNIKFSGFSDIQNLTVESDFNKNTENPYLKLSVLYPKLVMDGYFHAEGNILSFPVKQDGPSQFETLDVRIDVEFHFEKSKNKGVTYLKINNAKSIFSPTHIRYKISNVKLANGLDFDINPLLNENDLTVFNDVRVGYEKAMTMIFVERANEFFNKVPYDDIFLP